MGGSVFIVCSFFVRVFFFFVFSFFFFFWGGGGGGVSFLSFFGKIDFHSLVYI